MMAGATVKARREALGLTQRALADDARVHVQTVIDMEADRPGQTRKRDAILAALDRADGRGVPRAGADPLAVAAQLEATAASLLQLARQLRRSAARGRKV